MKNTCETCKHYQAYEHYIIGNCIQTSDVDKEQGNKIVKETDSCKNYEEGE